VSSRKVVLCYPLEARHCEQIVRVDPSIELVDAGQEGIAEQLLEADIFIGHAKVPVPWDQIVQQGRLEWIQSSASGLDHCLVPAVLASEIPVSGVSGLFARQVAEQTLAMLLGLVRSMPTFYHAQQAKQFLRRPTGDLHGMTVGIVGLGGNGRQIARVLAPLGVRILATDLFPCQPPEQVEVVLPADQLDSILPELDVLVLCVPLTGNTTGMIGEHQLQRLKQGAILVNVARGPLVIENDLVRSLQSGHLAGAALDVTEVEPLPAESPLWDMPGVIITPHVAAQSARRIDETTDFICSNLRRFLDGQPLENLVDKQLGFPRPPHATG
jgi:D-3-phosphoglycerate dehydrogenase